MIKTRIHLHHMLVMLIGAVVGGALAGVIAAGSAAVQPSKGAYAIELKGYVSVVCTASLNVTQVALRAGQNPIGQLSTFCNNPAGYQVWADYSPSLANATLVVEGRQVPLSPDGTALIDSATTASISKKPLAIIATGPVQGNIAIRVVCPGGSC